MEWPAGIQKAVIEVGMSDTEKIQRVEWVEMRGCNSRLSEFLLKAGGAPVPGIVRDLSAVDAEQGDAGLVLLYRDCERALALAMADGIAPSKALASWIDAATELATVLRKRRRQVMLIEASTAEARPVEVARALGLDPGAVKHAPLSTVGSPAGFFMLMASHVFSTSPKARRLNMELQASALPMKQLEAARPIDVDQIFEISLGGAGTPQIIQDGTGSLGAENRSLNQRLFSLQRELEERFVATQDTGLSLEDKIYEIGALKDRIHELETEITRMLVSKSWRITEPLRSARRLFSVKKG